MYSCIINNYTCIETDKTPLADNNGSYICYTKNFITNFQNYLLLIIIMHNYNMLLAINFYPSFLANIDVTILKDLIDMFMYYTKINTYF